MAIAPRNITRTASTMPAPARPAASLPRIASDIKEIAATWR